MEMAGRRSVDWQYKTALAVGLFCDYVLAQSKAPMEQGLLQSFARALRQGTRTAVAPLANLEWAPRSYRQAHRILSRVLDFLDWTSAERREPLPVACAHDTAYDQMRRARAAEQRKAHAFLGHLKKDVRPAPRAVVPHDDRQPPSVVIHTFNEDQFLDLCEGFRRRGRRKALHPAGLHLKDILILILMHGAGLRSCEPFHLFESDVGVSPTNPRCAEVRLCHPCDGPVWPIGADKRGCGMRREDYLRRFFDMTPRHLCAGRFHAGWKNLRLSNPRQDYSLVRWSSSQWGELFLELFQLYMAQRPETRTRHPFLFVSETKRWHGEPYTLRAFRQAYGKAVRAMGEEPGKDHGTSPHAHRHSYGKRMRMAGLDRVALQLALGHRSPTSQDVYGQPTSEEIEAEFLAVDARMQETGLSEMPRRLAVAIKRKGRR
jgi:hypothetical protein